MTAPFRAPVPPSGEPTHDLYCNYCHRSLGVSPDARLVYCNALCEALWDEEHADPTSPAPVSEQAPPHFVCGPTCGCGKSYPMVVATNVFPACWTLPTHCPHCGKENVGNLHIAGSRLPSPIISIAPPAPVSGEPASSHDWPEDFAHENGRYIGRCRDCQSEFLGHKRRLTCKACAPAAVSLDGTRLAALLIDEANAIANWASELEAALSDFPRDEDLAKDVAQTRGDEAQLRALASRLQALLSDARRLDWLEANADRWSIRHVALSGKWLCDGADELLLDERFATMREAIDAASSVDRASQSAASTETTWQGQPKMREIL